MDACTWRTNRAESICEEGEFTFMASHLFLTSFKNLNRPVSLYNLVSCQIPHFFIVYSPKLICMHFGSLCLQSKGVKSNSYCQASEKILVKTIEITKKAMFYDLSTFIAVVFLRTTPVPWLPLQWALWRISFTTAPNITRLCKHKKPFNLLDDLI